MKCHICNTDLYGIKSFDSKYYNLECRNAKCPLRKFVERCRLYYSEDICEEYFYYYCLWIPQDQYYYKIDMNMNRAHRSKFSVERTSVEKVGERLIGKDTKDILQSDVIINISPSDDLSIKVPKMLSRIKMMVVFG